MREARRYVIVGAFVVAAVLTPPDVLSQFMLAMPLILLYELGIYLAGFIDAHSRNPDSDDASDSGEPSADGTPTSARTAVGSAGTPLACRADTALALSGTGTPAAAGYRSPAGDRFRWRRAGTGTSSVLPGGNCAIRLSIGPTIRDRLAVDPMQDVADLHAGPLGRAARTTPAISAPSRRGSRNASASSAVTSCGSTPI